MKPRLFFHCNRCAARTRFREISTTFGILAILSLFLFRPGPVHAEEFGPVSISEIPLAKIQNEPTVHGYIEYRFRITNRDKQLPHTVAITLPESPYVNGSCLTRTSNRISVPAEQTVVLSILQPPIPIANNNGFAQIQVDGYMRNPLSCNLVRQHCSEQYGSGTKNAHILTGVRVQADTRDLINKGLVSPGSSAASPSSPPSPYAYSPPLSDPLIAVWEAESPVGEWSPNWLAYTRFDGIALTSGELREMQDQYPEIFAAVRRFVESGGLLYVIGTEWTPPKEWDKRGGEDVYHAVLGTAYITPSETAAVRKTLEPFRAAMFSRADSWTQAMQGAGWSRHHGTTVSAGILGGSGDLLNDMRVLEHFGVPVKTIMVLILVFAILIGPVNIVVLSLMKRRIWLLWTVPATSVIASLFVYGADYLREGFLRQTSSHTITILDQRRQEALTFGFVGFYSTFTPGGGLAFDPTTEATCAYDRSQSSGASNRTFEMQMLPGGAQQFANGWVRARLPSYFAVRKAEPMRKERLDFNWEIVEGTPGPTVANSLGVDVDRLVVCGPNGTMYTASSVKAGEKVVLIPDTSGSSPATPSEGRTPARFYESLVPSYMNIRSWTSTGLGTVMTERLPPGYYAVQVGGDGRNPFLEKALDRASVYRHETVIYGIL